MMGALCPAHLEIDVSKTTILESAFGKRLLEQTTVEYLVEFLAWIFKHIGSEQYLRHFLLLKPRNWPKMQSLDELPVKLNLKLFAFFSSSS